MDERIRLAIHWRCLAAKARDRWLRAQAEEKAYMLCAEQLEDLADRIGEESENNGNTAVSSAAKTV